MGYDILNGNPLSSMDKGFLGVSPCEITYS